MYQWSLRSTNVRTRSFDRNRICVVGLVCRIRTEKNRPKVFKVGHCSKYCSIRHVANDVWAKIRDVPRLRKIIAAERSWSIICLCLPIAEAFEPRITHFEPMSGYLQVARCYAWRRRAPAGETPHQPNRHHHHHHHYQHNHELFFRWIFLGIGQPQRSILWDVL